jgi:hypothetical protein
VQARAENRGEEGCAQARTRKRADCKQGQTRGLSASKGEEEGRVQAKTWQSASKDVEECKQRRGRERADCEHERGLSASKGGDVG